MRLAGDGKILDGRVTEKRPRQMLEKIKLQHLRAEDVHFGWSGLYFLGETRAP